MGNRHHDEDLVALDDPAMLEAVKSAPLPSEFWTHSNLYAYGHTVVTFVLLALVLLAFGQFGIIADLLLMIPLGLLLYRLTFVIHDCCHFSLFSSRRFNKFIGHISCGFVFVSFKSFTRLHMIHHKHYGKLEDPQAVDYFNLKPGRDRVWFHIFKPLLLMNLLEKTITFFQLQISGMTKDEIEEASGFSASIPIRDILILFVVQAIIFVVISDFLSRPLIYAIYPLSAASIVLFLSRLRTYLEHGELEDSPVLRRVARSTPSNWIESNILSALNFNYHFEHHAFPSVSSCHLPKLHEHLSDSIPSYDYSPTYLESIKTLSKSSSLGDQEAPESE